MVGPLREEDRSRGDGPGRAGIYSKPDAPVAPATGSISSPPFVPMVSIGQEGDDAGEAEHGGEAWKSAT